MDDWSEFNDYYRKNPPEFVLDDDYIRFQVEIAYPGNYKPISCTCGKIHLEEDQTWYHSWLALSADKNSRIKVCKKCKECHEILKKELVSKYPE